MPEELQISGTRHSQPCGADSGLPTPMESRRLDAIEGTPNPASFQAVLLGMAGHDLRQPLQVIQSTYEWLEGRVGEMERVRLRRGQQAVASLAEHLDSLVGAMCLLERTRDIAVTAVALMGLLQDVARGAENAARAKGIEVRICPTSVGIMSQRLLLDCIVRNLVDNAIKYTQPGGRILIGCRRVDGNVRIDVIDTGVGLAPGEAAQIFQAFQRLHSTRCDGLGIGLFLARRAAELLGHDIEVSSTPLRGSRFSVFARTAPSCGLA